jgi:thymidylate kinase
MISARSHRPREIRFVVLESIDRGGTSTQLEALTSALRGRGLDVAITAYPDEEAPLTGPLITALRNGKLPLVPDMAVDPEMQMLLGQMLFSLNRREKATQLEELLAAHYLVISSRYQLSGRTYAEGKGISSAAIGALHAGLEHDLRTPDLTLVIDADPDAVAGRAREVLDAFEADLTLQRGVRAAYQRAAAADERIVLVDGIGTPAEITARLLAAFDAAVHPHAWDATDSAGHSMECSHGCGARWGIGDDEVPPGPCPAA